MGAVTLATAPAAGSCQDTPSLDDSEALQRELNVTASANGLPLTTATGELSLEGENSLVPAFESTCGSQVAASLADNRLRVEIAGSSLEFGPEENESDPQNGIDGYASLAADLTGSASPVALTVEASFLSDSGDGADSDQRYFGGRSWLGFFDQRVEASAEVALSLDNGEGGSGFATQYEISADLWQSDSFSLSSFAGFTFANADYEDDGSDAIANRLVREIGASINWGRTSLSLQNSLATDNVDEDGGAVSNQWTTWDAEVGFDLSDLHPVIPNNLSVGFEIEEFAERDGGALAANTAEGLSRAIDLDLAWDHHGGTTEFGVSQSIAWEGSMATDRTDQSRLEIGLGRSIEAEGWSLSAEGTFFHEVVSEYQETHRHRSLSFDLGLDFDPSPNESISFEAGLAFDQGSEGSSQSFGQATALLTYDLQF
jgi:hypothetical protein